MYTVVTFDNWTPVKRVFDSYVQALRYFRQVHHQNEPGYIRCDARICADDALDLR